MTGLRAIMRIYFFLICCGLLPLMAQSAPSPEHRSSEARQPGIAKIGWTNRAKLTDSVKG
jgi:hypothetical protein